MNVETHPIQFRLTSAANPEFQAPNFKRVILEYIYDDVPQFIKKGTDDRRAELMNE